MVMLSLSHCLLEVWSPASFLLWLQTGGVHVVPTRVVRVALVLSFPSLALSVAFLDASSMSFMVPYEIATKKAVPSVRHQGL